MCSSNCNRELGNPSRILLSSPPFRPGRSAEAGMRDGPSMDHSREKSCRALDVAKRLGVRAACRRFGPFPAGNLASNPLDSRIRTSRAWRANKRFWVYWAANPAKAAASSHPYRQNAKQHRVEIAQARRFLRTGWHAGLVPRRSRNGPARWTSREGRHDPSPALQRWVRARHDPFPSPVRDD